MGSISRTSGAYLGDVCFVMSTPLSQEMGPPANPGRFRSQRCAAGANAAWQCGQFSARQRSVRSGSGASGRAMPGRDGRTLRCRFVLPPGPSCEGGMGIRQRLLRLADQGFQLGHPRRLLDQQGVLFGLTQAIARRNRLPSLIHAHHTSATPDRQLPPMRAAPSQQPRLSQLCE